MVAASLVRIRAHDPAGDRRLLRQSRALTPERFLQVQQLACAHAAHIERYPSYYFSPNTHLTGEALSLYVVGTALPRMALRICVALAPGWEAA